MIVIRNPEICLGILIIIVCALIGAFVTDSKWWRQRRLEKHK